LAQLGFLVVGLQLAGQIFSLAESLAMQFLYPLFYRRISAYEKLADVEAAFSDLLNTLVPVYLVLTGLLFFSAPYLLRVLVSPQFQDAVAFIMLGAVIELFRVLGNLLGNAAHVRRKTKSLAMPYAAGSMTALALIYFAGSWHMELGWAAAALLLGAAVMLMVMWVGMRRQVRFTLDFGCWIWTAAVTLAVVLLAIWMPRVSGWNAAIGILLLAGAVAGAAIFALLWNNPATLRLLNAQLRKN
jgi:O-antigen/teichoic acid export membrane protein